MRKILFFTLVFLFGGSIFCGPLQAQEGLWHYSRTGFVNKTGTQDLPGSGNMRITSLEKTTDSEVFYKSELRTKKGNNLSSYNGSQIAWQRPATFAAGEELKLRYTSRIKWSNTSRVYGIPDAYLGTRKFVVRLDKPDPLKQAKLDEYLNYDVTLLGIRAPKGSKNGEEICITIYLCQENLEPSGRSCAKLYYTWRTSSGK